MCARATVNCRFCRLHRKLLCMEGARVCCTPNELVGRAYGRTVYWTKHHEYVRIEPWLTQLYLPTEYFLCVKIYWIYSHLIEHCSHWLRRKHVRIKQHAFQSMSSPNIFCFVNSFACNPFNPIILSLRWNRNCNLRKKLLVARIPLNDGEGWRRYMCGGPHEESVE